MREFQARLETSKEMVEAMILTTSAEVWFRQSSEWYVLLYVFVFYVFVCVLGGLRRASAV